MNRYRIKHSNIKNLWIARTTPKQFRRNGDQYNTTSTPDAAWSYQNRYKAEELLQKYITNQTEHNKHRPKGMPKPLDPKTIYEIEEYPCK